MGVHGDASRCLRNFDRIQHANGGGAGGSAIGTFMKLQHLGHLPLHREVGVKRGHGVLKDHGHSVAPNVVQRLGGKGQQIASLVQRFATGFPVAGQQPHQGEHALTFT